MSASPSEPSYATSIELIEGPKAPKGQVDDALSTSGSRLVLRLTETEEGIRRRVTLSADAQHIDSDGVVATSERFRTKPLRGMRTNGERGSAFELAPKPLGQEFCICFLSLTTEAYGAEMVVVRRSLDKQVSGNDTTLCFLSFSMLKFFHGSSLAILRFPSENRNTRSRMQL